MPTKVTGEDGRVLHDNLNDQDAADLARRVYANTGEVVTLTPYEHNGDEWVLNPDGATTVGAAPVEAAPADEQAPAEPKVKKPPRAPRKPKAAAATKTAPPAREKKK